VTKQSKISTNGASLRPEHQAVQGSARKTFYEFITFPLFQYSRVYFFTHGGILIVPVVAACGKTVTLWPSCHCTQFPNTLAFGS
jgi:hypothetical protein